MDAINQRFEGMNNRLGDMEHWRRSMPTSADGVAPMPATAAVTTGRPDSATAPAAQPVSVPAVATQPGPAAVTFAAPPSAARASAAAAPSTPSPASSLPAPGPSMPLRSTPLVAPRAVVPPHLTNRHQPSTSGPTSPLAVFRSLSTSEKIVVRRTLEQMGISVRELLDFVGVAGSDHASTSADDDQATELGGPIAPSTSQATTTGPVSSPPRTYPGTTSSMFVPPVATSASTAVPSVAAPGLLPSSTSTARTQTLPTPSSLPYLSSRTKTAPLGTTATGLELAPGASTAPDAAQAFSTSPHATVQPSTSSAQSVPVVSASATTVPAPVPTAAASSGRYLQCKPDVIGDFKGEPDKVEGFISRFQDLVRSDPTPEWQAAVVRALTIAMKDNAAVWHESLTKEEAAALTTTDAWATALREAFPVNAATRRKEARTLTWSPDKEPVGAYFYKKLRLLRQAYGYEQSDATLVSDIRDGLPPSMKQLIQLSRKNPTLNELRSELNEWESTWHELRTPSTSSIPAPGTELAHITATAPASPAPARGAAVKLANQSMARSASAPALPRANPPASSLRTGMSPLAATYDPSRITPAANGRPRTYRRPDKDTIMTLDRPCGRCGEDHFNFEHDHLRPPQVRMTDVDDDYPEQPFEEGSERGSDF
ncbi:hypothetical protein OC834_007235 [Tilletia horrida]|nr:hypothetical protein OC834_007235 [Tilletia horrida]